MLNNENVPLTSLRGVAALWIVAHHLMLRFIDTGLATPDRFLYPAGGAVDIFFILSGLVMAAVYSTLTPSGVPSFMIRRVFRIYPLHLFVMAGLVAVALLRILAGQPPHPGDDWSTLPQALLLLQPFRDQPLTWSVASWSVGIEMACYLAFPLLLPLMRWLPRPAIFLVVAVLAGLELLVQFSVGAMVSGLGAIARGFVGFSLGMALALALRHVRLPQMAHTIGEPAAVAAIVLALGVGLPELTPLAGAVLIGLLFIGRGPVAVLLEKAWAHWIGKISYSVYLTHLPVIGFLALLFGPHKMPLDGAVGLMLWSGLAFAAVLAVSHLTWQWVEEPARRYGARLSRGGTASSRPVKGAASAA